MKRTKQTLIIAAICAVTLCGTLLLPPPQFLPNLTADAASTNEKASKEKSQQTIDDLLFAEPKMSLPKGAAMFSASDTNQSMYQNVNEEVLNEASEIVLDAVNETYVKTHLNETYAMYETMELANMLMVKQTVMDGTKLSEDDTIDSVMFAVSDGDVSASEKFIAMFDTTVALYNVSDNSDYLVGFANTMMKEKQFSVQDALFAITNNNGEVIDGCVYDKATGLAYIPKKYFQSDDKTKLFNVQVQLMQVTKTSSPDTYASYAMLMETDDDSYVNTAVGEDLFRMDSTIRLPKDTDLDKKQLVVNGLPVAEDFYTYEEDTNTLCLNVSSGAVSNLSVVEQPKTRSKSETVSFYSSAGESLASSQYEVEFTMEMSNGQWASGNAWYAYGSNGSFLGSYGYINLHELVNLIWNGGNLDYSALSPQETQLNILLDLANSQIQGFTFHELYPGASRLWLQCAHVSNPMGQAGNEPIGGRYGWVGMGVRVLDLYTDAAGQEWATIGFLTQTTHTQAGSGVARFRVKQQKGRLDIQKVSADTDITDNNPNYSLEGAVYGIYSDESCQTEVTRITTDSTGFATTGSGALNAGNYWVKEITPSKGFSLDPSVHPYTVIAGT